MRGMCAGCMSAPLTISFIQERLREYVTPDITVVVDEA
jgi:Fe-S cluster biogenesis protein NfuA